MWGQDFILPPAFWPALFRQPTRRRPKGRRQDKIPTPLLRRAPAIGAFTKYSELSQLQALMSRYSDRPMDFPDATLVYLAKREGLATIFTVDRADFDTYRIEGRLRFRVLPASRP
jgi:predicted nucleic acid-binding protein